MNFRVHNNYKNWEILEKVLKYLLINFEKNILANYQTLHH